MRCGFCLVVSVFWGWALSGWGLGCSGEDDHGDGAVIDAGTVDAAPRDAGPPPPPYMTAYLGGENLYLFNELPLQIDFLTTGARPRVHAREPRAPDHLRGRRIGDGVHVRHLPTMPRSWAPCAYGRRALSSAGKVPR